MRRTSPRPRGGVAFPGPLGASWQTETFVRLTWWVSFLALVTFALGCGGRAASVRYASVLDGPEEPRDVAQRIQPPNEDCLREATHAVDDPRDILRPPLPAELREGYSEMLRGLHPLAKQVLRRTGGIWFADRMPGASARFVPCDGPQGRVGLILVDINANPLDKPARDVDIPTEYWRLLGGHTEALLADETERAIDARHRAARYVMLHEIGHALSLLSGEFVLSPSRQFELGSWDGFSSFSWRPRSPLARLGDLHRQGGMIPVSLALSDWERVRNTLGSGATWLAPGYRKSNRFDALRHCHVADRLPRAGFVTPTAATAPTEDYAELFAHAILAAEGKLHPDDVLRVRMPGCEPELQPSPYYSGGVASKRAYIEEQLGLAPRYR